MSMVDTLDKYGEPEDKAITSVRGQQILISADIINTLLFIDNPPPVPNIGYNSERFFKILRPGVPLGPLKFSPSVMPPIHRILWYIYSRNLVQKGKNFTHFNSTDYMLFASLMDKVAFNIGHWVFQEMKRFKFQSSESATIPFPNLVSHILYCNKIWYLDSFEKPVKPDMFGQAQLNYMKISFQEGSGQSRAPSRSRPSASRPSASRPTEAQSSPAPSMAFPESVSFTGSIRDIVEKAMQETFGSLQTTLTAQQYELSAKLESEVGKLVKKLTDGFHQLEDQVDAVDDRVENVEGHFEDLGAKIDNLHNALYMIDTKVKKLLEAQEAGPSHSRASSPPPTSPIHMDSPLYHSPPPVTAPHLSSAPPTIPVPSSIASTVKLSSSGDTADLFDEHSSASSITPSTSPRPSSPLPVDSSIPTPPSLTLSIYSPLPILQSLRASLSSGTPILPDDKGGEKAKEKKKKKE